MTAGTAPPPPRDPAAHPPRDPAAPAPGRRAFRRFLAIPTRWADNDSYQHVNNVVYYAYFDTVVNEHLVREGGLDIARSPAIGLVVETRCRFMAPLGFPEVIDAGLAVTRLGGSSVSYTIGLFRAGSDTPAALGQFVHVWVDRATRISVPIPSQVRAALAPLVVEAGTLPVEPGTLP